jgi:hypothetical protein
VRRARITVGVVASLAAMGVIVGAPIWISLVFTLGCIATPFAVGAMGGSELIRAVFLNPARVPTNAAQKDTPRHRNTSGGQPSDSGPSNRRSLEALHGRGGDEQWYATD